MNFYYDTEFTGLHANTKLLSIGMVAGNKMFYGEIAENIDDYKNNHSADDWIVQNVIDKLERSHMGEVTPLSTLKEDLNDNSLTIIIGSKSKVSNSLIDWIDTTRHNNEIDLFSDVCAYDTVLFNDLILNNPDVDVFSLPSFIPSYTHDINHDIALAHNISYSLAFDLNRERLLAHSKPDRSDVLIGKSQRTVSMEKFYNSINKHNALYDALVIKNIYESLYK